jgi:uncharacterized protein (DUF302 family)
VKARLNNILFPALLICSLSAQAQAPAQPTQQQMQQAMVQQAQLMSVMFDLRKSRLGFEETVNAIRSGAEKRGWKVGPVQDMQAQMREAGARDAKRMKVIPLCPAGASEKVARAGGGKTPPLPCRATIFDGKDGQPYVMRMNLTNLSKTLQGELARVMAEVGAEEEALYRNIVE